MLDDALNLQLKSSVDLKYLDMLGEALRFGQLDGSLPDRTPPVPGSKDILRVPSHDAVFQTLVCGRHSVRPFHLHKS